MYGVPYLEPALGLPDDGQQEAAAQDAERAAATRSHASVLSAALGLIRADAAARGATRTVVLAHAWVTGGRDEHERAEAAKRQASASERDISVGGVGYVPASVFDGFGYVALGHLHGRQTLAQNMRYSGSPLPYSFSEKDHEKGTWLVELGTNGTASAEWVKAPVHRRLTVLPWPYRGPAHLPRARRPRARLRRGDPHRHRPPRGGDGAAPREVPAHPHA